MDDTRPSGIPTPCRIPEPDRTRVEIAAQLNGLSRSAYVARAAVERAQLDLERIRDNPKEPGR